MVRVPSTRDEGRRGTSDRGVGRIAGNRWPVRNWGITDATTGQLLGGVEIRDIGAAEVNLTYVVFPAHRRRGIATRASKLALDHAARELGARTAVIKILEGNAASRGVARRLDANEDGTEPSEAGGTYIVHRCRLADVSRVRR